MKLKDFIKTKREEKNQTQQVACEKVGVSQTTWIAWEKGRIPLVQQLFKIADWAGIGIDELRGVVTWEE